MKNKRKNLLYLGLSTIVLLLVIGYFLGSCNAIPKKSLTKNQMIRISNEIDNYYSVKKQLPLSIDELGLGEDKLRDAWGNKIIFVIKNDSITMKSKIPGESKGDVYEITYQWEPPTQNQAHE